MPSNPEAAHGPTISIAIIATTISNIVRKASLPGTARYSTTSVSFRVTESHNASETTLPLTKICTRLLNSELMPYSLSIQARNCDKEVPSGIGTVTLVVFSG